MIRTKVLSFAASILLATVAIAHTASLTASPVVAAANGTVIV